MKVGGWTMATKPRPSRLAHLLRDPASVNRHWQSSHERRRLRTQPYDRFRDLLRFAHPSHRLGRLEVFLGVRLERARVEHPGDHWRSNYARAYRVDADALLRVLESRRLGHHDHAALGRVVSDQSTKPDQPGNRRG